jgi:hypothetical protein
MLQRPKRTEVSNLQKFQRLKAILASDLHASYEPRRRSLVLPRLVHMAALRWMVPLVTPRAPAVCLRGG